MCSTIYRDILDLQDIKEKTNLIEKYFIIECLNGNLEAIKFLHNSIDIAPECLERGFQQACKNGHLSIIKFIESVHILYHKNFSWYIASSTYADFKISKYLLDIADKIKLSLDEQIILQHSCKNGNQELFNYMITRKQCHVDSRCMFSAVYHTDLFKSIQSLYTEKFNQIIREYPTILIPYYSEQNDFKNFQNLITNDQLLKDCLYSVISSGNLEFINFIIDKYENFNVNLYLDTLLIRCILWDKMNTFIEYLDTLCCKFPDQNIDFTLLVIKCSHNTYSKKLFWIMNTYQAKIDFHKIIDHICLRKITYREEILLYILKNKFVPFEYIQKYTTELIFSSFSNHFFHEILKYIKLPDINKHPFMIKYSCKTNILKIIFNKDILYYVNDF